MDLGELIQLLTHLKVLPAGAFVSLNQSQIKIDLVGLSARPDA